MSRQLALSSALSVLMMSMFALLGPHTAANDPLGMLAHASPLAAPAPR